MKSNLQGSHDCTEAQLGRQHGPAGAATRPNLLGCKDRPATADAPQLEALQRRLLACSSTVIQGAHPNTLQAHGPRPKVLQGRLLAAFVLSSEPYNPSAQAHAPRLKVLQRGEDVGQQEVEQGPQFRQVVLRRAGGWGAGTMGSRPGAVWGMGDTATPVGLSPEFMVPEVGYDTAKSSTRGMAAAAGAMLAVRSNRQAVEARCAGSGSRAAQARRTHLQRRARQQQLVLGVQGAQLPDQLAVHVLQAVALRTSRPAAGGGLRAGRWGRVLA